MNVAQTTIREAYLSSEFGLNLALKWTGLTEEEIAKYLGRNKKGKRKGFSFWPAGLEGGGVLRIAGLHLDPKNFGRRPGQKHPPKKFSPAAR